MSPRKIAENNFVEAAKDAALFELRTRLRAGAIPTICDKAIRAKLSDIRKAITTHYKNTLGQDENATLISAVILRNKVLHCEFSAARKQLAPTDDLKPSGGVERISNVMPENVMDILRKQRAGEDVGQHPVAKTKTAKHEDIFGWLLETDQSGDFVAASNIFREAIKILERLSELDVSES
jgi:hypothetical protein